jgi:putative polymerase
MATLMDVKFGHFSSARRFSLPVFGGLEETGIKPTLLVNAAAFAVIFGAMTFNLFLCFVNTRVFPVLDTHVMMAEMVFIGCAFAFAADRRSGMYVVLAIFITYMMVVFALRNQIDLKALRDILIPVAFFFMGQRLGNERLADRLVTFSIIVVLGFGLFEYLATELFLDYFNVIGYYISRGTISVADVWGQTRGLYVSGVRPEPRTLLPFLGQHRVASIFLEPVSEGNFGAIVYAWALFRNNMPWRWLTIACALAIIVMADARFGLYTCILMTLLFPFYNIIPKPVWMILPFLFLALIAIYGLETGTNGGPNDIAGRFDVTAAILTALSFEEVIGSKVSNVVGFDSGLTYSLTDFGILGFAGLWAIFVYLPVRDLKAWKFHSQVILYFLLLLTISNSGYTIKTGAMLWFLLGTATVVNWTAVLARPADRASRENLAI